MSVTAQKIWRNFATLETPALWVGNQSYSYRELGEDARRVLKGLGNTHQKPVAVIAHRHISSYRALLACLFSGNIFMPLNPGQPVERSAQILRASGCTTLIASKLDVKSVQSLQKLLPELKIIWQEPLLELKPAKKRRFELLSGGYAYLMYTSGTTGTPKGIGITHANLDAYVDELSSQYDLNASDRFSQHSDLTFDLSVHDWALSWSLGATLYVIPPIQKSCPADFLRRYQITTMLAVPAVIPLSAQAGKIDSRSLPSLRLSFFCGQTLSVDHADRWASATRQRVVNLYGPTEATIAISAFEWQPGLKGPNVPIGKIFSGQHACIGEDDELLLAGSQVIKHYWQNPEADNKAFCELKDRRWYRSGDKVARTGLGLMHLGRLDHQVKIQGHRIEPGELESVTRTFGLESAAVPWPLDESGEALGIALCVTGLTDESSQVALIRQALAERLPNYMQPGKILGLASLPLNANGKTDIKALQNHIDQQEETTHATEPC